MRMRFNQVFESLPDGRIMPIVHVQLGPMTMPPRSAALPPSSVSFGNVNLSQIVGKDLEVNIENGLHIIVGAY